MRRPLNLRISFSKKKLEGIFGKENVWDKTIIRRLDHCRKSENGLFRELADGAEGRRPTGLPWPEPGHYDLSQSSHSH